MNSISIQDIVLYAQCPLKYRYNSWSNTYRHTDTRDAVSDSLSYALSAYMKEAMLPSSTPTRCVDRAIKAFKKKLSWYDINDLLVSGTKFAEHFNFGLILIKNFHNHININYDVPIAGPFEASYQIDDYVITGPILGTIAYNQASRTECKFGIVQVREFPSRKFVHERLLEGFSYGVIRSLTKGLKSYPLSITNIDPVKRDIKRYAISQDDQKIFEALARACIAGIKNNVYVPQPLISNCRTCFYYKSCDISLSSPNISDWRIKEFINKL